ncbi:MAG: hypothetical protein Ct9H300mP1_18160 [Planctomycetaceae bacterium]|nr:MAG: hypothetical protein Ct9H300mP1_18160 [Planctomycetaceae bacterium]
MTDVFEPLRRAVIAVARHGTRINSKIGDIHCVRATRCCWRRTPASWNENGTAAIFTWSVPRRFTRRGITWLAGPGAVMLAMVGAVALEWSGMFEAALVASFVMLITGCLRGRGPPGIDWSVVWESGRAWESVKRCESPTPQDRGRLLFDAADAGYAMAGDTITAHPQVLLALVAGLTLVLTNVITAKAAAVLMFPIATETRRRRDANPMPFVVAVALSAASSLPHRSGTRPT